MFEDNDDLGVTEFEEDFNEMFENFKMLVKHISKQQDNENEYVQGDFLGIRTKTFEDNENYIYAAISGSDSGKRRESRDGKSSRGEEQYTCIVKNHNMLDVGDRIELLQNLDTNFEAGTQFRVEPENKGNFRFNSVFQRVRLIRL